MTLGATAPRPDWFGVRWAATLAVGCYIWLEAIGWVSGSSAFEHVGLTLEQLAGLYGAGFLVAGLMFDALVGRLGAIGRILQGLLIAFSSMVLVHVNMGLSWGSRPFPISPVFLIIFAAVGGVLVGYSMWLERRPAEAETARLAPPMAPLNAGKPSSPARG